ncbi:MAG TPA: FtsK/SpoIIIE domain-containing protein [Microbacterium sp.]|nr:FtsK/SpoIIIE domain-containing protein [Microbacterium sp.]
MDSQSIALPSPQMPARRPPVPFLAAVVPIVAGIVLWLVTGSLFALCFAALGPLMLVASLLDGMRSRRRDRRLAEAEAEQAWARAEADLDHRRSELRERLDHRHPDAARCILQPPLRGPEGPSADTEVVVGRGAIPSGIRTSGGEGDRAREFQTRSGELGDAPVTALLGKGICLRGPAPIVAAAARALVVQLCMRFGPAQLALIGDLPDEAMSGFPHVRTPRRGAFRLGVAVSGSVRSDADAVLWLVGADADVPEGVTTVIDCAEPQRATLRTPIGLREIAVECLSASQTALIAQHSAEHVEHLDVLPDAVALHELEQQRSATGLPAVIGRGERGDVMLDIVHDGPHAIVTGTTGTGKSELLVTWVTALAQRNGPETVTFILADFKGGTAFEPLRDLPQVAAVITDLDDSGARRGVSSLTAELRRREGMLAAAGARDISEIAASRLVIVVDEFAALLQEHPDLGAVFTDVAARGRALGMHLILGTQRASGVVRDALAANCPLRVSLRVGDAADSRLVLGSDAAAELPGGASSRGLALARRPQDTDPFALRVALTGAADLRAAAIRWAGEARPQSPWLAPLPRMLALAELEAMPTPTAGALVLGLADEPERQAQPLALVRVGQDRGVAVLGGTGSGKSAVLRTLAAQRQGALWIPNDAEQAWDAVTELAELGVTPGTLVLCDDIDRLLADLPVDHAQQFAQRWEQILRAGVGSTFVLTAARAAGPVARLIDALPVRALLRMPSRVEHLAAGGESSTYERGRAPGRARIGEREVQVAWVTEAAIPTASRYATDFIEAGGAWVPEAAVTGIVSAGVGGVVSAIGEAYPWCDVVLATGDVARSSRPLIVVGDAESWQRSWALWQRIRAEGEILVRAECQTELRQLAGVRELPPFSKIHAGRAWSLRDARGPRRVVVPALAR